MKKKRALFPKPIQQDYDWAFAHYADLAKQYPEQWVAFANRHVLSAGSSLMRVLQQARRRPGSPKSSHLPHLFVEGEVHIYVHRA